MAVAEDAPPGVRPHLPGEAGIWVFILGDMLIFASLFIVFVYYRGQDVALYADAQRTLNQHYGALNTFLMLTSSWCVALALNAARAQRNYSSRRFFMLGMLCGVGFVGVKFFEYREKIRAGFTLTTNDFYMYYYMLTGLHLMHVLLGLGVLAYLRQVAHAAPLSVQNFTALESGASFWHMVDMLWIVLFALLYLLR